MHGNASQSIERACDQCGSQFTPRKRWARFCKAGCRNAWHAANDAPPGKRLTELERRMAELEARVATLGAAR